jgi:hypothetical protein
MLRIRRGAVARHGVLRADAASLQKPFVTAARANKVLPDLERVTGKVSPG